MHNEAQHSGRIIVTHPYTLRTLTVQDDTLIAVNSGTKFLHLAGRQIEATSGEALILARGTQWDVTNDPRGASSYQALALGFTPSIIQAFYALEGVEQSVVVTDAKVIRLDEELRHAIQETLPRASQKHTAAPLLYHRVMTVLLLLAERGFRFATAGELSWAARIRRLVAQRPHAKWDVPTLAKEFHLSESSLRRRLSGSGLTLAALVREVRLETALGLLQTTQIPIGAVALHCGWQSHSRFCAAFQDRWGVAPSIVRANPEMIMEEMA